MEVFVDKKVNIKKGKENSEMSFDGGEKDVCVWKGGNKVKWKSLDGMEDKRIDHLKRSFNFLEEKSVKEVKKKEKYLTEIT